MTANFNFRKPVMEIVNSRFDLKRKNQVSGSGEGPSNHHPYRRPTHSTDLMMDKSNLEDSDIVEGRRIRRSLVGTSSSSSSGDIHYGGSGASTEVSESVGVESNILGSSIHHQHHQVQHELSGDIVDELSGVVVAAAAPKSMIDPVAPVVNASASNQKILSCYYRTLPYEGNELTFVYIKRMRKTVNMNISRIPWLIQRLSYYYSLKGDNMQAMGQALENCFNMYANVASEIDESELDI